MKILVLGAGQVGSTAAYHLAREEANEVTIVDSNPIVLRDLQDRLDVRTVLGHASSPGTLERAGCANMDTVIALTSSDEVNMIACQVAHTLFGTPTKIARVRSAEYINQPELFGNERIPVDLCISPEQLVTRHIEQLIRYPGAFQVLDFADGKVRLVGARAHRDGPLVGQEIRTLHDHIPGIETRIAAIYREGEAILPEGKTRLLEGDEVFFIAARQDIGSVMRELRKLEDPVRRIIIAGAGNIGFRAAQSLEKTNQVKIIEQSRERARIASEGLASAIVLRGDAADESLLLEENIDGTDVFVSLTNAEEVNILSAMLAKRLGCRKVMALINRPSYAELVEGPRIDVGISPPQITIGALLAYVRQAGMVRIHSLRRGRAEAIEAIARGDRKSSRVIGRRIEEIALPKGATINIIVRGNDVLEAHHDTIVQADDHLILFVTDRRQIQQVERLFRT
ncbi:MAG: Trk system potassium transporter TrkA [Gammaproteobacteria bacterium]|jgi:trk system potassium uptake protein TrkA|nr:Trk system potassium transporter TrkA [Gammaproteobacteria bacterium]